MKLISIDIISIQDIWFFFDYFKVCTTCKLTQSFFLQMTLWDLNFFGAQSVSATKFYEFNLTFMNSPNQTCLVICRSISQSSFCKISFICIVFVKLLKFEPKFFLKVLNFRPKSHICTKSFYPWAQLDQDSLKVLNNLNCSYFKWFFCSRVSITILSTLLY